MDKFLSRELNYKKTSYNLISTTESKKTEIFINGKKQRRLYNGAATTAAVAAARSVIKEPLSESTKGNIREQPDENDYIPPTASSTASSWLTAFPQTPKKNRLLERVRQDLNSPSAFLRSRAIKALKNPNVPPEYEAFDLTDEEEGEAIPDSNSLPTAKGVLSGTNVYVEVRSGKDNRSEGVKKVIAALGARISNCMSNNTTHVIFKDGRLATYKRARVMGIPIVSILWIEACKKQRKLCDPSEYPISNIDRYDFPELYEKLKRHRNIPTDSDNGKPIQSKPIDKSVQLVKSVTNKSTPHKTPQGKSYLTHFFKKIELKSTVTIDATTSTTGLDSPATVYLNRISNMNYSPLRENTSPNTSLLQSTKTLSLEDAQSSEATEKTTPNNVRDSNELTHNEPIACLHVRNSDADLQNLPPCELLNGTKKILTMDNSRSTLLTGAPSEISDNKSMESAQRSDCDIASTYDVAKSEIITQNHSDSSVNKKINSARKSRTSLSTASKIKSVINEKENLTGFTILSGIETPTDNKSEKRNSLMGITSAQRKTISNLNDNRSLSNGPGIECRNVNSSGNKNQSHNSLRKVRSDTCALNRESTPRNDSISTGTHLKTHLVQLGSDLRKLQMLSEERANEISTNSTSKPPPTPTRNRNDVVNEWRNLFMIVKKKPQELIRSTIYEEEAIVVDDSPTITLAAKSSTENEFIACTPLSNKSNHDVQSIDVSNIYKEQSAKAPTAQKRQTMHTQRSMEFTGMSANNSQSNMTLSLSDLTNSNSMPSPDVSSISTEGSSKIQSIVEEEASKTPLFCSTRLPSTQRRRTLFDKSMEVIDQRLRDINDSSRRRSMALPNQHEVETPTAGVELENKMTPNQSQQSNQPGRRKLFVPNAEALHLATPKSTQKKNNSNRRRTIQPATAETRTKELRNAQHLSRRSTLDFEQPKQPCGSSSNQKRKATTQKRQNDMTTCDDNGGTQRSAAKRRPLPSLVYTNMKREQINVIREVNI